MIATRKALIFDVDGTLAETEEAHRAAFNLAFEAAGLPWRWDKTLYRDLLKVTGGKERLRHFLESAGETARAGDDRFIAGLHADKTRYYTRLVETGRLELRPGVRALMAHARENGLHLAIATTTTPDNVEALLVSAFGPTGPDLFPVTVAGDMVPNKKPAPDAYLEALDRLGLDAADCLALEDSRNGLISALAAGIDTLVTPSAYLRDEDFSGALAVLRDLGVLADSGFDLDRARRLAAA